MVDRRGFTVVLMYALLPSYNDPLKRNINCRDRWGTTEPGRDNRTRRVMSGVDRINIRKDNGR